MRADQIEQRASTVADFFCLAANDAESLSSHAYIEFSHWQSIDRQIIASYPPKSVIRHHALRILASLCMVPDGDVLVDPVLLASGRAAAQVLKALNEEGA